ncbi:MAG: hypothetical protein F6K11_07630 [Leptolyngbya sp. SIO3F4]|nr:hypothetical protein [Leptolyngbya sp. SIO3F4]
MSFIRFVFVLFLVGASVHVQLHAQHDATHTARPAKPWDTLHGPEIVVTSEGKISRQMDLDEVSGEVLVIQVPFVNNTEDSLNLRMTTSNGWSVPTWQKRFLLPGERIYAHIRMKPPANVPFSFSVTFSLHLDNPYAPGSYKTAYLSGYMRIRHDPYKQDN